MSDIQDSSDFQHEERSSLENRRFEPIAGIGEKKEKIPVQSLNEIQESLDGQTHFLVEVAQSYLVDPQRLLPMNSDRISGSSNPIESMIADVAFVIQEEVTKIQGFQKKIDLWDDRIEENKTAIAANESRIKQNNIDIVHNKKNRDYWLSRAEQVTLDYSYSKAANRLENWAWLIKKYGLKNAEGSSILSDHSGVEELCESASKLLAGEYKIAGEKYELSRCDLEMQNHRLIHESAHLKGLIDTLKVHISAAYTKDIEPLQVGLILLKELHVKLKSMSQNSHATFGELRSWAEPFINDFIKTNSRVLQSVVTQFRKLASIPLPPQNS